MKAVEELIKSIPVNKANFEYMAKTGKINGGLLVSLRLILNQQQPSREKIIKATEEAYAKWNRLENENTTYLGELIAIELSELLEGEEENPCIKSKKCYLHGYATYPVHEVCNRKPCTYCRYYK